MLDYRDLIDRYSVIYPLKAPKETEINNDGGTPVNGSFGSNVLYLRYEAEAPLIDRR